MVAPCVVGFPTGSAATLLPTALRFDETPYTQPAVSPPSCASTKSRRRLVG